MHSPADFPSPRASWEWAQTLLLVLNLVWTTLCLGGYRPETMVVTSVLTAMLLVVHLAERVFAGDVPPVHPAGWILLPFLVYAAANVHWVSPVPWLGWIDWFWWAEIIAVFWVVLNGIRAHPPRRVLFVSLIALALIGVALASYQRFVNPGWLMLGRVQAEQFQGRASGSFGSPNSLAALLLLLLPAVGAILMRRRAGATERVWWAWVLLVLAFGLVLTISRGAGIALALALTMWPLFARQGNWRRRVVRAVGTLAVALAAGAMVMGVSPNFRERFDNMVRDAGERSRPIMWRAAWQLFREKPALGTGAASYNILFEQHRPERFADEPQWAHNDYLNTLSDYGAIGAVLWFGGCAAIALGCARRRRAVPRPGHDWFDRSSTIAGLGIGLLAFGFHQFVDFHYKIPALAMAFATVAALAVGWWWPGRAQVEKVAVWSRAVTAAIALAGAGAAIFVFAPAFRAEALRYAARQTLDQFALAPASDTEFESRLAQARADLAQAVAINPANAQAWADLSYATALWALVQNNGQAELGAEAEAAAGRALALGTVNAEFWYRRGVARDMQGRWHEAGNDFAQALVIAPNNALAWFYHADHLSRKASERALADAALAFCLRLDPGNPAGLALRQRLAISSPVQ